MYRVNRDSLMKPVYREKVAYGMQPVLFCDRCLSDVGLATTLADP